MTANAMQRLLSPITNTSFDICSAGASMLLTLGRLYFAYSVSRGGRESISFWRCRTANRCASSVHTPSPEAVYASVQSHWHRARDAIDSEFLDSKSMADPYWIQRPKERWMNPVRPPLRYLRSPSRPLRMECSNLLSA